MPLSTLSNRLHILPLPSQTFGSWQLSCSCVTSFAPLAYVYSERLRSYVHKRVLSRFVWLFVLTRSPTECWPLCGCLVRQYRSYGWSLHSYIEASSRPRFYHLVVQLCGTNSCRDIFRHFIQEIRTTTHLVSCLCKLRCHPRSAVGVACQYGGSTRTVVYVSADIDSTLSLLCRVSDTVCSSDVLP
jgi:hypothetical protein